MSATIINTVISDPDKRTRLEKRFWAKVSRGAPGDCWLWTAKAVISDLKYGAFVVQTGCVTGAHRVAFALANGSITVGLSVLHQCDTPKCCNPAHLYEGTQSDNSADMMVRGRHNPPKITPEHKKKISDGWRRNPPKFTEKHRKTASSTMKRLWADPSFREKMKDRLSGSNNPNYGRQCSEEQKQKIRETIRRKREAKAAD